jgi:DNA-binding transcriptional LysR family regulator
MERAAHALERRAEGFETEIAGEVRLTLTPSVGDLFLAQLFDGFAAALPRVQLVVHVSNEIIDLQRRQADVALRFVRPSIGDLSSRRVARVRHRVLASAKFARGLGTVTSLSQLPWVLPEAGVFRRLAEGVGARAILTTDSVVAQLDLVRAGLAVAVLPTFFERVFDLRGIELKKGAREPPWPETDVWLVTHTSARRVPRISAVASWLTERVPMMVANG